MTILSGAQVIINIAMNLYPTAIGVDATSGYVYVSSYYSSDVTVLSGTRVIEGIPVGRAPVDVALDSVTHLVYVANQVSRSISIIGDPLIYWPYHWYMPTVFKY